MSVEAPPKNKLEQEIARDPWGRAMIAQPMKFQSWVPDEIKVAIAKGLPEGLTRYDSGSGQAIVVWVHRSGGMSDHQLYRYFPEDLAFYRERTKDPSKARLLHQTMIQWNRMMWHLVEERGISPNDARAEIRRIDAEVFRIVLEAMATMFASAGALGSTGRSARAPDIRRSPIRAPVSLAQPRSTFNPFKGKTPEGVDAMFRKKGFEPRGPDPMAGKGGYVNPKTGRSYHIDPGGTYERGVEHPHVDVNRVRGSKLPKRKLPLGDKLTSKE